MAALFCGDIAPEKDFAQRARIEYLFRRPSLSLSFKKYVIYTYMQRTRTGRLFKKMSHAKNKDVYRHAAWFGSVCVCYHLARNPARYKHRGQQLKIQNSRIMRTVEHDSALQPIVYIEALSELLLLYINDQRASINAVYE